MINKDFVNELFELCKKHKQNVHVVVDSEEENIQHYEVDITGAWEIRTDCNAVEVQAVPFSNVVMEISGKKCVK